MSLPVSVLSPALRPNEAQADPVVCHCMKVKLSHIHDAQNEKAATSVEEVMEHTEAGTGCRACHCRIRRVLAGLSPHCTPFGGPMGIIPCTMCGCSSGNCPCRAGGECRK